MAGLVPATHVFFLSAMPQETPVGGPIRAQEGPVRVLRGLIDPPELVNNKQKTNYRGYGKDGLSRFRTITAAATRDRGANREFQFPECTDLRSRVKLGGRASCAPLTPSRMKCPRPARASQVALRDGSLQIRSGKRVMKLSRFGIFTFGSVCAFIASFSPMSLLRASRKAVSA
jgi:hypothetical protein